MPADREATSRFPVRRVVVVGGGIAGLAAATALAERGVEVVLLERQPYLGGRVGAWPVADGNGPPGGATMSRGFHAFFRQYYNLRGLLRRTDPALERLTPLPDYPLVSGSGARESFATVPRIPPWNLIGFVLRSPSFRLRDLGGVDVGRALDLLAVDFPATFSAYDGVSAQELLDRLGFPDAARHLALEVFARSFFARPEDFAAGEMLAMFHSYFLGSSEGLLFDVPSDDYDSALWAPLGRYLHGLGVDVRTGVTVGHVTSDDDGVEVSVAAGPARADAVVLATDPAALRTLAAGGTWTGGRTWRDAVAAVGTTPPFAVLRLWLDRPARADRPAFLGTSGLGPLDNVTLLERFEAGSASWAEDHGGSVVELHAYAIDGASVADRTPEQDRALRTELRRRLAEVYPETADALPVAEQWLVRDDCWALTPAPWADRPTVATDDPRVVLAGDGIRCDLPVALMERAATTGMLAANRLLASGNLPGHDLWSVPLAGRHRVVRAVRGGPRDS